VPIVLFLFVVDAVFAKRVYGFYFLMCDFKSVPVTISLAKDVSTFDYALFLNAD